MEVRTKFFCSLAYISHVRKRRVHSPEGRIGRAVWHSRIIQDWETGRKRGGKKRGGKIKRVKRKAEEEEEVKNEVYFLIYMRGREEEGGKLEEGRGCVFLCVVFWGCLCRLTEANTSDVNAEFRFLCLEGGQVCYREKVHFVRWHRDARFSPALWAKFVLLTDWEEKERRGGRRDEMRKSVRVIVL